MWFPARDAERLLDVVERELPQARAVIKLQDQKIDLQAVQIRTATISLGHCNDIAKKNQELADRIMDAYDEEVARNNSFFNQPLFLVGTGVIAGALIVAAAFIVKDRLTP